LSAVERQRRNAPEGRAGDQLGLPAVGTDRHVADQRDPVQGARLVVGDVTRWLVRGRAVVPERHAARLPPEPHGVLGTRQLLEEELEELLALAPMHADDVAGEVRVDVERPLPRLRVHAHDGMMRHQQVAPPERRRLAVASLSGPVGVLGPERVGQIAHRRRQALVRGDQIGPDRVAADRGDHLGAEDRREGRVDRRRHVTVEPAHRRRVALLDTARAVLLHLALPVHRVDLRIALGRVGVVRVRVRQLAEPAPECDLLLVTDRLVAEEEHPMLQQRLTDVGDRGVVERRAEVDAVDLGADPAGDRADLERGGRDP
jgi:hypothetical protein